MFGRNNQRSVDEIHREISQKGAVLIALYEVDKEVAVVIGAENIFRVGSVLTVFYNMRTVIATRAFAVPVLNPKAMFVETVGVWLIGIFLKIT